MPGSSQSLCLAMIVRDEAEVLARCLDSVAGLADELVIVDTGSKDRTKDIAASYADRFPGITRPDGTSTPGLTLLDFKWCDDFAAARNFALDHVNADWILHLDADEECAADSDDVRQLLSSPDTLAYYMLIFDVDDAAVPPPPPQPTKRLFRNDPAIRYRGLVHEYLDVPAADRVVFTELPILHHSGSFDPQAGERRSRRNIALLETALATHAAEGAAQGTAQGTDDAGRAYSLGLLANEYQHVSEFQKAVRIYRDAIAAAPDKSKLYVLPLYRDLAQSLLAIGRERDALKTVREGQRLYPAYTDLVLVEGDIHRALRDKAAARKAYLRCLQMGDPPLGYLTLGGAGSWRAEAALARLGRPGR